MALKDLVASAQSTREEDIEAIVADYVRYDVDDRALVLTSQASRLSKKAKVLVLLVANEGWVYVDPDIAPKDLKPKVIEELTGIAGGTLRPLLRSLAEDRIVKSVGGAYKIVAPNLPSIRDLVENG